MSRSEIRFNFNHFLVCCGALALFAPAALAEVSGDDQKCINELNKNLAKVASTQGKDICSCIKNGSQGKLGGQTIEVCMTSDNKGKVGKAKSKTLAKAGQKCPTPPSFGPTDPNVINH